MLRLENVCLEAGGFALREVSFEAPRGVYAVLMGPTGSGKTTLLEVICGLRRPDAGTVWNNGRDLTNEPVEHRRIGYVPQDAALFSTMTVRQNLAFPLLVRGRPSSEIDDRVAELARRLGIGPMLSRRAGSLSGGERQRTAIGRALASEPEVLLLDEPLSALDEATRGGVADLLAAVHAELGVTTLHVTHNSREAERLAGVRLQMKRGRLTTVPNGRSSALGHGEVTR
ncbi:Sulfate/thiosulfate import ATP-binding protein CysA [Posidoniimonas corsicana]|uniref:Sulfate/thiosulfate import ATP-binding protein CysA n=1 Tax=Posidoniimonas corsicana TaxID=1938618 RepID=A0A5C5VGY3_9BACT|nr:ABC transporter ATP-binding protein [Posidoniimonas corsicana]TWT37856.1 Sulfate/thiosulfate import ATP-binding protein CysA [Posidoniimonas corsicana]